MVDTPEDDENCPLHEAVFKNDLAALSKLIKSKKHDIGCKDKHGNTALHLAVMLGKKDCVDILLEHGAPVKVKNSSGWSPLAEAISYGNRDIISSLVRKFRQQARQQFDQRRPNLIAALKQMDDFYLELKWDFQSWVPLLSRILPSDICKVHKCGANIRLDSTLVDFSDMRWERGDISFLFRGDENRNNSLTVLDNKMKVFQRVNSEDSEIEIEDEVDLLMSTDILSAQMSTKNITFVHAQSGWIFREDRTELVAGQYNSDLYIIQGLSLESRKRREHLTTEDLQRNKAIMQCLTNGAVASVDQNGDPIRRLSLEAPPSTLCTWEEYIRSDKNDYPPLGRAQVYKESSKSFRATVAMSENFPLSINMLLNVLEVIGPFKHFAKLRDFVNLKLPPGFPVKIEIPILPTVTAKITFENFEFKNDISHELFVIPKDYMEDRSRFPDL